MPDETPTAPESTEPAVARTVPRRIDDHSVNVSLFPGGMSFTVVAAMVCVTVLLVLIGTGQIDANLIWHALRGPAYGNR